MGVIDCLCVRFVLTFFVRWTIGVRDKQNVALNCSTKQTQKTAESLATPT